MRAGLATLVVSLIALVGCAASFAAAAPAKPPRWMGWEHRRSEPRIYRAEGFTFQTHVDAGHGDGVTPVLTISAPGKPPLRVKGAQGLSTPSAGFLVMPADPPRGQPAILFQSYTGGAHCCEDYELIVPTKTGWRVTHIGGWDGPGPQPQDIDGDGQLELLAYDQRFDYRLTSHAESYMPPVIYVIRDGKLVEVSRQARFRPLFRKALPEAEKACREAEGPLGPCLGYVAIAARAGQAKAALALLDSKPDDSDPDWQVPARCGGTPARCAHEKPTRTFKDRHAAVVYFLTDLGYLPKAGR